MTALTKYLSRYAEADIHLLEQNINPVPFQQGLVVPVYREDSAVVDRFAAFAEHHPGSLIIIVINRPDNDPQTEWAQALLANRRFSPHKLRWQSAEQRLSLYSLDHDSAILLVDRCIHGPALAKNRGVGLARKIGADILCQLIHWQRVALPWIANTDADAYLPADYFTPLQTLTDTAAVVYPFEHGIFEHRVFEQQSGEYSSGDANTVQLATLLYEFSLRYYVCGLSWAGSPYAFHTLGSTIAVHYQHYAKVRGFPKRAAAEDFYLLNKVAKTGLVNTLEKPLIQLQARLSSRVPFGTGPAVGKLAAGGDPLTMAIYHPHSFVYLRLFLQLLAQLADSADTSDSCIANTARQLAVDRPEPIDPQRLLDVADSLQLAQAIHHSHSQGREASTRRQHLQQWFDGFKTLKFIHCLRDRHLGTISARHWLEHADSYTLRGNKAMDLLMQRIKAMT